MTDPYLAAARAYRQATNPVASPTPDDEEYSAALARDPAMRAAINAALAAGWVALGTVDLSPAERELYGDGPYPAGGR